MPRLSIGLPVYNGERYLAAALGSILDQSFTDFELIISDNASTDRTEEICQAFAADDRISYHRNTKNLGAAANYNLTVMMARGDYFKWAAHDDVCATDFLARCIQILEQNPEVVLCHSQSTRIDDQNRITGLYANEPEAMEDSPHRRFWSMISQPHYCIPVFGVMRTAILRQTPMHGDYVGADRNLLAEISLRGKIAMVPEPLFKRREHSESSISKYVDERERLTWFSPRHVGRRSYPTWRRLREYAASVQRVPLGRTEKLRCWVILLRWLGTRHHTGRWNATLMLKELLP